MNLSKITAIFDQLRQDSVEEALIGRGVSGLRCFLCEDGVTTSIAITMIT